MKEEKQERLFRALGDVGSDLIDMAEKQTFAPSHWRKWGSLAACLAVILCLSVLALPYFPMGCGSGKSSSTVNESASAADMAQDTVAEAEAEVTEEPAEEIPAEEPGADAGPAEEFGNQEAGPAQTGARAQLTFRNTVYYVEALYSEAEGEAVLGAYLGTVEDGDRPEWTGCKVYSYHSYDENQTEPPVDILVETAEGYLYCVTYQLRAGAPFDIVDTLYLLEHGEENAVAQRYAAVFEAAGFTFEDPAALSSDQLLEFFLLTLQMEREAGIRTEDLDKYLWYDAQNDCYAVPAEDVKRQLDRYLTGYVWDPPQEVFRFDLAPVQEEPLNLYAWDYESGVLTLTVESVMEGDMVYLHRYIIEFTDDACCYRSIAQYFIDN